MRPDDFVSLAVQSFVDNAHPTGTKPTTNAKTFGAEKVVRATVHVVLISEIESRVEWIMEL